MNPYILTKTGTWPFERYTIQLNESVIDFRPEKLPVDFIFSPYFAEDNNYAAFNYSSLTYNSLLGLSTNTPMKLTEFGYSSIPLSSNFTLTWTPSSFRNGNYGNILGCILLYTSDYNYYLTTIHPSQLFLYPTQVNAFNSYSYDIPAEYQTLTAIDYDSLNDIYISIEKTSAYVNNELLLTPIISSINYYLTGSTYYESYNYSDWLINISNLNIPSFVYFLSGKRNEIVEGTTVSISSYTYITSSNYIKSFIDYNSYALSLNDILSSNNYYRSNTVFSNITSVDYKTFIKNITSSSYFIQTSSVLLEYDSFQFNGTDAANNIKAQHSNFLSKKPENILSINSSSISNIVYNLSGNITRSNNKIINFTENYNPVVFNKNLEKNKIVIRPDSCRLCYHIKYKDYRTNTIDFFGDEYGDFSLKPDKSIGGSYIIKQNNNILTFQMYQSSSDFSLPLEDSKNCVLSSTLNLDNSNFKYENIWKNDIYGHLNISTPISGVPGKYMSLRYIAESPFINETETIESSIVSVSSYPSVSINTPTSISNSNNVLNWTLKYPPYYYIFKGSYNTSNSLINYTNKSSLIFYLSSTVLSNNVTIDDEDYYNNFCTIDLYTSVYSDFDIVELPLKTYGFNDYIKYTLENTQESIIDLNKIKAYIIDIPNLNDLNNVNILEEYDIINSPYVPALNGSYLRILYNISGGGGVFTIIPTLSTKVGVIDSYWATTFPVSLETASKNYIKPFYIQTLYNDITSVVLSVQSLTSENSINLRDTQISWIFDSNQNFTIKNITPDFSSVYTEISSKEPYDFKKANLIEINGLFQTPFNISLSSEFYERKTTKTINPDFFDLYHENRLLIEQKDIDKKNQKKLLKFDCKVPIYNQILNVRNDCSLMWNWNFNNITTNEDPVSSYIAPFNYYVSSFDNFLSDINSNIILPYAQNNILTGDVLSSLYVLIEVDKTISEESYPFDIRVQLRDFNKILNSELNIEINSHPSNEVFSTDFKINYPNFLGYDIVNTKSEIKTLTRPPNGTNLFNLEALSLNSLKSSISSMEWVIETIKTPLSAKLSPTKSIEHINIVKDVSGFFDPTITKDFNEYNTILYSYKNLQYINPSLTSAILSSTDVDLLNSYLDTFNLSLKGYTLNSITSSINNSPLATSIYVSTTSLFVSSFYTELERDLFLNQQNNVYFYSYSTETLQNIQEVEGELVYFPYDVYSLNLYLSSTEFIISDNQTVINNFNSDNIVGKNNIIKLTTSTNKTSSFDYSIYIPEIENNAYFEYDISLISENVSILNWSGLYNFKTSARIIIPAEIEFSTSPDIFIIPRFIWNPEWKQKNKIKTPEFNFIASGNSRQFTISGTDILNTNSDISVTLNNLILTPDITIPTTATISYISDGSTKNFSVSGLGNITDASYIKVYADGSLLTPTTQYTLSSNVVTLSSAIPSGFRIDIHVPIGYNLDSNVVTLATFPDSGSIIKIYGISDKPIYKNILANKFVSILDNFDKTDNHLLTGKSYANMLSSGEYNIIVQGIQDTDILLNDPIEIVVGVGDDSGVNTILDDQIINDRSQYILNHNEIYVENFVLPSELNIYDDDGMTVYLTAFNRFFPNTSSVSYYGINELSSAELEMFTYPITAKTHVREYDDNGIISGNIISYNPRLYDYEPFRFLFYPETTNVDLDSKRIIKVKQIIETIPNNSPNILQYDKSSVVYVLSSDFWTATTTVPAISNGYVELFKINTGDPSIPLTVSDYGISNLVLTASATIASQITNYTFSKYTSSEYTGERNLWGISYQTVIGNENYPTISLFAKYENTFNIFDTISSV